MTMTRPLPGDRFCMRPYLHSFLSQAVERPRGTGHHAMVAWSHAMVAIYGGAWSPCATVEPPADLNLEIYTAEADGREVHGATALFVPNARLSMSRLRREPCARG